MINRVLRLIFRVVFFRTDTSTEKIRIESNNGKNNRSSTGSRPKLEDDSEKQLEMQLLESPLTETNIRQPKKEVRIIELFFSLTIFKPISILS